MKAFFACLRAGRSFLATLPLAVTVALGCLATLGATDVAAQTWQVGYGASAPIIVRNDLGGDVGARANKIRAMAAAGQSVEIRGACYSACTMYLALPGSCILRTTQFGFHRPSFFGVPLRPKDFEFWSQVIAAHYPPALKSWYLSEGRYSASLKMLSGAQLISLGVPECGQA